MGVLGFAARSASRNWGMARSTATNAALLITVEPISLILLSPVFLGERLTRRELVGAVLTLVGAVPRGPQRPSRSERDARPALARRHPARALRPLLRRLLAHRSRRARPPRRAARDRVVDRLGPGGHGFLSEPSSGSDGHRPVWTPAAIWGTVYLAIAVTALGYLVWNYALERVEAPRLALFVNVQPVVGALLGVWWLREPLTVFTVIGGLLVLLGLHLAMRAGRMV